MGKEYNNLHYNNIDIYAKKIARVYDSAIKEAANIASLVNNFSGDKLFSFADHPIIKDRIGKLLKSLTNNIEVIVLNGIDHEWTLSNNKNSELSRRVFGDNIGNMTKEQEQRYFNNNHGARDAFKSRKIGGLNLSDSVWKYTNGFKHEIELGIDCGLRDRLSAADMARDLKQYLQSPDKLFRRVRDEHGNLVLSKAAKAFNPGQGVYRSSVRNTQRLARTEINMAYHASDHERWQQLDFVVGIEVRRSNNHSFKCPMCDSLVGKYPKEFVFSGWHPQCRCHAISILKTPEEMQADNERILNGTPLGDSSINKVNDVNSGFTKWIDDNKGRFGDKNTPYFIRDNFIDGKIDKGLNFAQSTSRSEKHIKSASEKLDIQQRWDKRQKDQDINSFNQAIDLNSNVKGVKGELTLQLRKTLGYDVSVQMSDSYISLDVAKAYAKEYALLCNEYNLEMPCKQFSTRQLKGVYGQVSFLDKNNKTTRYVSEIAAKAQNTGQKVYAGRIAEIAGEKSLCDAGRLQLSTINHEFAHNLFITKLNRSPNALAFEKSLEVVHADYYKELASLKRRSPQRDSIYIGQYANRDINEFFAEAFQEYRNRKTPSKYATIIGKLVDKHFKK